MSYFLCFLPPPLFFAMNVSTPPYVIIIIYGFALQFLQQYRHYQSTLQIFQLKPSEHSKPLDDLIMFLCQVGRHVSSLRMVNILIGENHLFWHWLIMFINGWVCKRNMWCDQAKWVWTQTKWKSSFQSHFMPHIVELDFGKNPIKIGLTVLEKSPF